MENNSATVHSMYSSLLLSQVVKWYRVFKFSRCPAQVTGYFKHLCRVLFVFHKAAVIVDEIVLRLLYNFLLLLFFNLKTLMVTDKLSGLDSYGRPVVRDDWNLRWATKICSLIVLRTTTFLIFLVFYYEDFQRLVCICNLLLWISLHCQRR